MVWHRASLWVSKQPGSGYCNEYPAINYCFPGTMFCSTVLLLQKKTTCGVLAQSTSSSPGGMIILNNTICYILINLALIGRVQNHLGKLVSFRFPYSTRYSPGGVIIYNKTICCWPTSTSILQLTGGEGPFYPWSPFLANIVFRTVLDVLESKTLVAVLFVSIVATKHLSAWLCHHVLLPWERPTLQVWLYLTVA